MAVNPCVVLKNRASVSFERSGYWWVVEVYSPGGQLVDKVRCDNYHDALEYRRAFLALAKNL